MTRIIEGAKKMLFLSDTDNQIVCCQIFFDICDCFHISILIHVYRMVDSPSKNALKEKKVYKWEPGNVHFPRKPKKGKCEEILSFLSTISSASGSMTEACIEPGWRIRDIILAAKVLQKDDRSYIYIFIFIYKRNVCNFLFFFQ